MLVKSNGFKVYHSAGLQRRSMVQLPLCVKGGSKVQRAE